MDDNIQNYRQPMVTAIGIILGFVLGFTGKWATEPASKTEVGDYFVLLGLLSSIILLLVSLFRILNNDFPSKTVAKYYAKTLRMFIFGVSAAFIGVIISIIQTVFSH